MGKKEKITYIAVAANDSERILTEGSSMESVIKKADEIGEDYIIAPVLEENTTYIL
ncbi:hypothetical protein ES705_37974 [subsurface metagenome]